MRKILMFLAVVTLAFACGSNENEPPQRPNRNPPAETPDDGKGVGEVTNVTLNDPLLPEMVASGQAIYELKCAACHKLTDQRVVGPGWAGLTEKRKPEWIMNMITNVDVMLDEDPVAQELLKECLTRMPNQNLTIDDARDVLEFIYANDGYAVAE